MTLAATTPSALPYAPIPVSAFQQWVTEHADVIISSLSVAAPTFAAAGTGPDLVTFDGSSGGGDSKPPTDDLVTANDILK
jgi:hypothetical protein